MVNGRNDLEEIHGGGEKKKEQEKEGKFCTIQIQVRAQQEA